ncbi:hypothetical protein, partial [Paraburkholderia sp. NMBU_R16]|uniref:hypothetical protein n=1 Tax=Paraburkholderia sp. NMBU_R16 TaxID=2698676 RepID=UPI001C2613DB
MGSRAWRAITAACTASGSFEAPRSLRGLLASPATPSRRHRSYQTRSVFSLMWRRREPGMAYSCW